MLARNQKLALRSEKDFFIKAFKINGENFRFWYLPSSETKVAVIVGKKVDKSSVKRNSLKRWLFQWVKDNNLPNISLVITPFPKVKFASDSQMKLDLSSMLRRISSR